MFFKSQLLAWKQISSLPFLASLMVFVPMSAQPSFPQVCIVPSEQNGALIDFCKAQQELITSNTLYPVPSAAKEALDQAYSLGQSGATATQIIQKIDLAIQLYPDYAEAYFLRAFNRVGSILEDGQPGSIKDAINDMQKALEIFKAHGMTEAVKAAQITLEETFLPLSR